MHDDKDRETYHFSAYEARKLAAQPAGVKRTIKMLLAKVQNVAKKGEVKFKCTLKNQNFDDLDSALAHLRQLGYSCYDDRPYIDDDESETKVKRPKSGKVEVKVEWKYPERW